MSDRKLAAQVIARNRCNTVANELYEQMIAIFRPLIASKVCLKSGEFTKKVRRLLPPNDYPDEQPLLVRYYRVDPVLHFRVWPKVESKGSVNFMVEACAPDGAGGIVSQFCGVFITDLVDGVVQIGFRSPPRGRTDWTVEDITNLRHRYESDSNSVTPQDRSQVLVDLGPFCIWQS